MGFMLGRLLETVVCSLLFCTYEYPSDPLAAERISLRSGRLNISQQNRFNGIIVAGYDFSKGTLNPIVSTQTGKLEGYVMRSIKGRSIYSFEGIPYAETTAGKNRFELAIPKRPWSGVRPAKKPGNFCLQLHLIHYPQILGSEDCLFLNIYVPAEAILEGKTDLPVVVWFHGGSWFFGAGSEYGPSYLLENDVILVTVNYRLGILGFLSTGDEHMPGNLGLKDQRTSLQWVHDNIANFGGDPGLVTIAGQSGGAASVHMHMMSNSSRGYFSGAISLSGNAFSPWALMNSRNRDDKNQKIAKATNCPLTSSKIFVDCLRKISGRILTFSIFSIWEFPPLPLLPSVPLGAVIEIDRPGAFLTEHPDKAYAENRVAPVPWICSRTTNETEIMYTVVERVIGFTTGNRRPAKDILKRLAPTLFEYAYITDDPDTITAKISEFYLKRGQRNVPTKFAGISEAATDRIFGYPVHKSLQLHSRIAPTYSYLYGYKGRHTVGGTVGFMTQELGVSHIDDLPCIFNISFIFPGYKTTDPEYAVVKLMTSVIYNFALNRVPLFQNELGIDEYIWNPVKDPRNIEVLQVNHEVKMIPEPSTQKLKFWESLHLEDMKPFIPID